MFILGLLSFLQTVFIPGYIAIKYLGINRNCNGGKGRGGKVLILVYAFGLSLLINYLLVFVFTVLGIYKPLILYILLFTEGVMLIYYWVSFCKTRESWYINLDISRVITSLRQFFASHSLTYNFFFLLSIGFIVWHVFLFFYFLGSVFEHWDPVMGWNRFALDWANNQLPNNTWRYPQLIPANWSISYVMMQNTEVQCFAKAIMPLFSIAVLLLFLDLAMDKKKTVYLLALVCYGILLVYFYDPSYIVSGYVDIAVSFFAFLSFYAIHGSHLSDRSRPFSAMWWSIIFASTAAITKQSGLFILAVILVWAFGNLYKSKKTFSKKRIIGKVLLLLITVSIIAASWYIVKEIHIARGVDRSEIAMVQRVHQYSSYTERLVDAFNKLSTHRHPKLKPLVYAAILLIFLGLFQKKSWAVTLFIVIPYTLMWGFFFSYDNRNLAFAFPFIALSAAFGATFLKRIIPVGEKAPRYKIPLIPVVILTLLVLAAANLTTLKKETLIRHQKGLKMKLGNARLNELLYLYHEKEGITGKIATDYRYLQYLPGLGQFYEFRNTRITIEFLDYLESDKGKNIHFLLMPMIFKSEKEVYSRFHQKVKAKEYRLIFKLRTYRFVQVRRERQEERIRD